jgi:hypothetical protein
MPAVYPVKSQAGERSQQDVIDLCTGRQRNEPRRSVRTGVIRFLLLLDLFSKSSQQPKLKRPATA